MRPGITFACALGTSVVLPDLVVCHAAKDQHTMRLCDTVNMLFDSALVVLPDVMVQQSIWALEDSSVL